MKFEIKNFICFLLIIFLLLSISYAEEPKTKKLFKTTANDDYNFISINQILMWVSNNGSGSHNPNTDGPGFYWRRGEDSTHTAIFQDGLVFGGIVNNEIYFNGNTHRIGLQAGKILNEGQPDNPNLEKYRVYKLTRGWEGLPPGNLKNSYKKNYDEWPVEDGAPWIDIDLDGKFTRGIDKPEILGDEILWYVSNDLDTNRVSLTYGSYPIGLEIQTTVYGFNLTNVLGRTVFKKYKVINKSKNTIDSMYLGYWSDPDIGNGLDDYVGCDTILNLAFCYNADNNDEGNYGKNPPAVGYLLLKGPLVKENGIAKIIDDEKWTNKNHEMTSFLLFVPYDFDPIESFDGKQQFYNYLKGLNRSGGPFINPVDSLPTKFVLSGDPVNQIGWYEGKGWITGLNPGDRRILMSTGPFNLAPGDTQEITIAIIIARGNDNINSITELKQDAGLVQYFFTNSPELPICKGPLPLPEYFYLSQNYPNPFNPVTTIKYSLPIQKQVSIKVFDVLGREVKTLIDDLKLPGNYEVIFNATGLSSGIYFYRIDAGEFSKTKKMLVLK
ncbi:MAG: T9SS type A sorting domain-containing protein [Ignavibacteriales bacterium]|nr:T9SS type A sorting domain-containing protein [Ignavibacteriales bacterium]